jgi:Phage integrase, N-terminal SAM-like domain
MPEARGLYEVSREKMRTRHFAYRTEQAYLTWIRRYVNFHNRKHPRKMGSSYVEAFLTHLAVHENVSASAHPLRIRLFKLCSFYIGKYWRSSFPGLRMLRGHVALSGCRWC